MLFNSWIFIAGFLPVVVVAYSLTARWGWQRTGIALLTVASMVFYAYWDGRFLALLLFSIVVNYSVVVVLSRQHSWKLRHAWFLVGLAFNLGLLFFFKYALFVQSVATDVGGFSFGLVGIVLPLGISFYTFTQLAYLVDAYQKRPIEQNLLNYALFVTFFPHLIAGPILHHYEMMPQFLRRARAKTGSNLVVGVTIFVFGLGKKVLLADGLLLVARPVFDSAASGAVPDVLSAWTGLLAYTLQIYFDFSGYSDMAIGISKMLGIRLPINFASPYQSTSIVEFWRRWHITLSRFLRDYLYIPLGGNRSGSGRRYFNVFTTMFLGGVWHGAGWTYVLWGSMHGVMIVVNQVWQRAGQRPMPWPAAWVITFLSVMLTWVPFRSADLPTTWRMYSGLLGIGGLPDGLSWGGTHQFLHRAAIYAFGLGSDGTINPLCALVVLPIALFVALGLPNVQYIMGASFPGLSTPGYPDRSLPISFGPAKLMRWQPNLQWSVMIGILAALSLLKLNDVTGFIYFRF